MIKLSFTAPPYDLCDITNTADRLILDI